jgi:hypothetical protein
LNLKAFKIKDIIKNGDREIKIFQWVLYGFFEFGQISLEPYSEPGVKDFAIRILGFDRPLGIEKEK